MEELNATEAKREFGELLIKVQTEPISIIRHGKPITVIVSDKEFHELESFKEQVLKLAISEGLDDLAKNKIHSHKVVFDNQNLRYVISNIIKNLDPKPYYHSEEF